MPETFIDTRGDYFGIAKELHSCFSRTLKTKKLNGGRKNPS